jgi:6-pyruvoyltetrahydropterin/6-carboxytetrahydropterin synthase
MSRYRMVLAKEDFKFAAAHFTIFSDGRAELLHGHVQVELSGNEINHEGLLVDLESFKKSLREICARLDSRTLLPAESPRLQWSRDGDSLDVRFGPRAYRLPADDTLLLPLANTSIELLARMLWHDLAPHLAGSPLERMAVAVEETAGQLCWYEDRLP